MSLRRFVFLPAIFVVVLSPSAQISGNTFYKSNPGKESRRQDAPLTLAQILTGLQTQGKTAETRTRAARNKFIAARVRKLGVAFELTEEREQDLRDAGATDELIYAIREKSVKKPKPKDKTGVAEPTSQNDKENKTVTVPEPGTVMKKTLPGETEMSFVYIPAGEFQMGSNNGDKNEKPVHKVRISQGFWMQQTEVTQQQWEAVMGNNPSSNKGCPPCPVENVSWNDAQKFIGKLNAQKDGYKYRLPTEAEWEYAARAGTPGDYLPNLDSKAWYDENSENKTHDVGKKQPNDWGLYDMHGNVSEWVQDWKGEYTSLTVTDPTGPGSGSYRVYRGGGFREGREGLRASSRSLDGVSPSYSYNDLGFRVVRQ